ncbi:MAG: hypothetical protein PGN13_11220 [Patulibacter minatonensis]
MTFAATIGSFPAGDPDAMRRDAALLHADATHLRTYASGLSSTTEGMPFRAPVAERVRGHMHAESAKLRHCAEQLDGLGTYLSTRAGSLEAEQTRWRTQANALAERQREEAAERRSQL